MQKLVDAIVSAILFCSGMLVAQPAVAQNKETLARFAAEPHVGPVEQGLVGVITVFRGKSGQVVEVRHGNGIVLRCDGFVLFSAPMLAHRQDEPDDVRPDIQVYLRLDAKPVPRAAPWPVHIPQGVPLRMVKLPNVHAPALRTLLCGALKSGDPLTVAWRPWDQEKSAFGPLQKRETHFAGPAAEAKRPAVFRLQEPVDGAPAGAVVLGQDGLAVGMIADSSSHAGSEFVAMEALRSVTNCVSPLPSSDAQFAASQAAGPAPPDPANGAALPVGAGGGMVRIPGGPVALVRSVLSVQEEMQGASIACLPPFDIDRTEVTNGQYWDWWSRLPTDGAADLRLRASCRPLGWAQNEPFPPELRDVPVLGVTAAAAEAYARAQGKRLPTPYEWCLAALGPNGESNAPAWMAQYVKDRTEAALRIKEAHLRYLAGHQADINGEAFLHPSEQLAAQAPIPGRIGQRIRIPPDPRIQPVHVWPPLPWLIRPDAGSDQADLTADGMYRLPVRMNMQSFSREVVETETSPLRDRYKSPMHVLAADSRPFDVSPYGVADMLFNAHEYVLGPPFAAWRGDGCTLFVNWVGASSKQLADDFLVLQGPLKSDAAWPVSRLLQVPASPRLARWLQIGLNVREAKSLFYLLAGWSFEIGPEPLHEQHDVTEAFPMSGPIAPVQGEFPVWLYRIWSGKSTSAVAEIAAAVDLDLLASLPDPSAPTGFAFLKMDVLRPIGFRCAR